MCPPISTLGALSSSLHGAGLQPLFSFLFREPHFGSRLQLVESTIQYSVLVKIDFPSILSGDEAISSLREGFADAGCGKQLMTLYATPLTTCVILQPSASCLEGIINCLSKILVCSFHRVSRSCSRKLGARFETGLANCPMQLVARPRCLKRAGVSHSPAAPVVPFQDD